MNRNSNPPFASSSPLMNVDKVRSSSIAGISSFGSGDFDFLAVTAEEDEEDEEEDEDEVASGQ